MAEFDPRAHLTKVSGRDYLPVKHRLVWLTSKEKRYTIDTEPITLTDQVAIFKAVIATYDENGAVMKRATGTKSETPRGFADYVEKAETGAIGRALGALGFGTDYAAEFEGEGDADRPVDSPSNGHAPAQDEPAKITAAQLRSLWTAARDKLDDGAEPVVRGLLKKLGLESTKDLTQPQATQLIGDLNKTSVRELYRKAGVPQPKPASPEEPKPETSGEPVPITDDEAALIRFRERVEASDDWEAEGLIEAAGKQADHWVVLLANAPSTQELTNLAGQAKQRQVWPMEVYEAYERRRQQLAERAAALTR